ncbi:MAG: hypothetical protein F3745_02280 [Nitrospinae bacterium]|nr:hypothetical protein [Nitrospinota bacterium]
MANTTVTTQVVVQFDDQFSDSANRALENYFKSFKEAQKKTESFKPIFETPFAEYFEELRRDFNEKSTLDQTKLFASIATMTAIAVALNDSLRVVGVTLGAFYLTWLAGTKLKEWLVGGRPFEEYVEGVKESLDQLGNSQPLQLPSVPQSLESTKTCLEQIQNMQDIFITVNLVDNATKEAKRIRGEIENTFSQDITQRVTIAEKTFKTTSVVGAPSSTSNSFFDGGPEFLTSSKDLTGFSGNVDTSPKLKVPGFASGIDRVPRDMLALIHKDEAVLPKNQADKFRHGNSSSMTIQNLNFSFNVPNGLKLDREEFRNLAFQMRDELKRLDQRMNQA